MIKETSRRKDSCLSRKRSSSNATNIFAESAKENIFSRKWFARKNNLFNKNFFLWENVPSTWLWHLLVTITFVWTEFVGSLEKNFASLKWTIFLKTFVCLWDEKKCILRDSRKLFARLAQNVCARKYFLLRFQQKCLLRLMMIFCATSSNFFCVRFLLSSFQAQIFWACSAKLLRSRFQRFARLIVFIWATSANSLRAFLRG